MTAGGVTAGGAGGLERVPSGIPGLDTILRGGFLRGGLYIVQGPPGTGKTTLGNQTCFNHVRGGGRALYVTLLAEYHARMMQHLGTMSFFDASAIPDRLRYLNGLRVLREDGLRGLVALLRREITTHAAGVLVIDGIVSARRVTDSDQQYNEFIHELQAVSIATNCTVFMLGSAQGLEVTPEHTMVDGIVGLNNRLVGWFAESTIEVPKFRGSGYLKGRHAFQITGGGLVVHPRIESVLPRAARDGGGDARVTSGLDRLDVMLGGGLPEASTTLVVGPSGAGKTTLGLQFLARSTEAEPGLLFGFNEAPGRMRVKAREVCAALPPLLDGGVVEAIWQPRTEGLIDALGERLLEAVERRGVRRLFIDGLDGLAAAASEPGRVAPFVTALMVELRRLGVTSVYTMEVPDIVGPSITAPLGDLSTLAENLVLLRYVELRSRLYRLVSILKVRDSDFDPSLHEYATTDRGLEIEEEPDSAEAIMAALLRTRGGEPLPDGATRPRRGG